MGVLDNIRGIRESLDIRSKEKNIGRDVVNVSTVEAKFLSDYGSFRLGLIQLLEKVIFMEGNSSIELKGKDQDANKLLKHSMTDPRIQSAFKVEVTASGNFKYSKGDAIEDILEAEDSEKYKEIPDDEDENVIYI